MNKYKAIIFDMDGTIVDTEKLWAKTTEHYLTSKGVAYTKELARALDEKIHGLSMHKSVHIIKEMTGIRDDEATMIREHSEIACALYEDGIAFIEGFDKFHAHIQQKHKLKSAIATNADMMSLQKTDRALDLKKFFGEHMYSVACVNNVCKPAPDIYLYAARQLGVDPKECIALEDSAHGVHAAVAAGMFCIAIDTARIRHRLSAAHMIVDAYHEIPVDVLLKNKPLTA